MASPLMIMTVQKWCRLSFDAVMISVMLMTQFSSVTESSQSGLTVSVSINGDPSNRAGMVHVSVNEDGNWSKVLRVETFSKWKVGNVVCRQLGFGPPTYATSFFRVNSLDYNTNYIDVDCEGNEKSLSECKVKTNVSFSSTMALGVDCLPAMAKEFEVAVVKMYDFLSDGIVLVFVDGRWGPICDSPYGDSHNLCTAVCKQMNFVKCDDYKTFTFGVDILALPVLDNVECRDGDILKTCDYVRLKNQTCLYYGDSFYEVACTNVHFTYDPDPVDYPDYDPDRRTGVIVTSVIVLSILGMISFLCKRARSELVTTPTTTVVPGGRPDAPPVTSLPPSYEAAEAYPLAPAPAPAYPPQENNHLLELAPRYPSEPTPGYPTVPMTEQHSQPRMDSAGSYPPPGLMQPNLAFPLRNGHNPSLAFPPQGSLTNQIPQDSPEDPELPTYEAATAQQKMGTS